MPRLQEAELSRSFPRLILAILRPYRRGFLALLIPLCMGMTALVSQNPGMVEGVFSRAIYRGLREVFGRIFGIFPFSVAEILLYLLIAGCLTWLTVQITKLIRLGEKKQRFLSMIATISAAAGITYFLFTMFCGLNYHRITFADQSGLIIRDSSARELADLYEELVLTANELRSQVAEDESGAMMIEQSYHTLASQASQGFEALSRTYPALSGYTPRAKRVIASKGMSYLDITGIYIPFTFEANVNADVPDYNIPFTMLHELSHYKGFMREDEANFIAYLASCEIDDAAFRYSGVAMALRYTGNALYSADPELYSQISVQLEEGVWRDFLASMAYWQEFEGPIAEVAASVNNSYLTANKQEDGTQSYGRMVDLLLADYRMRHHLD